MVLLGIMVATGRGVTVVLVEVCPVKYQPDQPGRVHISAMSPVVTRPRIRVAMATAQ